MIKKEDSIIDFKPRVYEVQSESNPKKIYYITNYRPFRFSCTCKDYLYRSHDSNGYSTNHKCKHIKGIRERLMNKKLLQKSGET